MLFFELLQVAIGRRAELTSLPSDEQWDALYDASKKHSLIGIAFVAVQKLPRKQWPHRQLLLKWSGNALNISNRNNFLSDCCAKVAKRCIDDGFSTYILKGQGNLLNYPSQLKSYRNPGDIDVWLVPKSKSERVASVVRYVNSKVKNQHIRYNHVDMPMLKGVEVEVHYRPSFFYSFVRNIRFQRWCKAYNVARFDGVVVENGDIRKACLDANVSAEGVCSFRVPDNYFNAVFQLSHIYTHLFDEGIGLRQLMDYYFVLQSLCEEQSGEQTTRRIDDEMMPLISSFGMRKFAGAVMWVLAKVFETVEMEEEGENEKIERLPWMICEPDEPEGRFLLSEIMRAGNFGKYDDRIKHGGGTVHHAWEKLKHNYRLIGHYPEEAISEPCFRLYHWFWRKLKLWRFE